MRTPAAPLRRTGRLCREQLPGRSRYSFVPSTVAIRDCDGLTPRREGPVRPGSRAGRVVRRLLLFWGGAAAGVGWTLGGASAPNPLPWDSYALSPLVPRPTAAARPIRAPRFRNKRARPASHQSVGLPGLRPRTPEWRTRGPVTTGCHRCGWPRRLPLGSGSPAAPGFSVSRSG